MKGYFMDRRTGSDRASSGKWSVISESLTCVIPTDLVEFTDEEGYGRYLDLHDCYLKYINLKASEVRPEEGRDEIKIPS